MNELQVAGLEARLEHQGAVVLVLGSVVGAHREGDRVGEAPLSLGTAALGVDADQPPQVASPDQLPEVVGVELLV